MRLEINAGGLDSFFNGVSSFINADVNTANSNNLINSFQTVVSKTNSLNGGVGVLGTALGYIQTCKASEEARIFAVQSVKEKTDNFIQTAIRIDAEVAEMVSCSQESFYQTNPWLRPPTPPSNFDRFCNGVTEVWDGVVEFYKEHKKVIDTILIVAGAVLAIAAVICTGGMALAPLLAGGLTALGVASGTALTIATVTSLTIAGIAVVSTIGSSTLNIIDTWGEIDNPAFNTWQSVLNWTSGISNVLYSVGSIYNSVKGISNSSLKAYSEAWIKDSGFRKAISGADKFNFVIKPNSSTFWAGLGRDGENVAKSSAFATGRSTLESTMESQGIARPATDAAWREASASYAMRSSGNIKALLTDAVGGTYFDASGNLKIIGDTWLNTERILVNINPNITSLNNLGRTFQIGSFFTGIMSFGESAGSILSVTAVG